MSRSTEGSTPFSGVEDLFVYRVRTPEAVEFDYELAGPISRFLASLLDHLLILAGVSVLLVIAIVAGMMRPILAALALPAIFLAYFGYFVAWEFRCRGTTLGKRALDLRVIDDRGLPLDFGQALTRNLLRMVDMLPFLVAIDYISLGLYGFGGFCSLCSPKLRRLGDMAAGTLVVRTRPTPRPDAIVTESDKYNSLKGDAVLRSRIRNLLTPDERELFLQLCLRRNELEFDARVSLFSDAAEYLEQRLQIQREPFLSPEKFVQNLAVLTIDAPPDVMGKRHQGSGRTTGKG